MSIKQCIRIDVERAGLLATKRTPLFAKQQSQDECRDQRAGDDDSKQCPSAIDLLNRQIVSARKIDLSRQLEQVGQSGTKSQ